MVLGDIHEDQGNIEEARALSQQALRAEGLSRRDRYRLEANLRELETSEKTQKGKNSNIPK